MPELNYERNRRGNASRKSLEYILNLSLELEYITNIVKNYKVGKPGFLDDRQFKAPYLISFDDGTQWILFTTTSIRDRVKEQYWDSMNIKEINGNVSRAYLVYPDSIDDSEKRTAIAKNNKIQNAGEYSTLEGIVSQDAMFSLIEEYALRNKTPSQIRDIKGKNFEKRIAAILSNPWNLEKWISKDDTLEGMHYNVFLSIVETFGLNCDSVSDMVATSDTSSIGLLPSGGPAKTDVLTTVKFQDGTSAFYTISCKRTSASSVSVHQYSADSFADVLDRNNTDLRSLLLAFQAHGAVRDRNGNRYITEEQEMRLLQELQPHLTTLCEWVIGGQHGDGKPDTQWARFIVIYDNNDSSTSIHTVDDYCQELLNSDAQGMFGTPFTWTYQGDRGTNIQLKCRIIK